MFRTSKSSNISKTVIYSILNDNAVLKAVELIRKNEIIALPTDTVYGLGCNFRDLDSLKRICEIKGRSEQKPVAICVPSIEQVRYLCYSIFGIITKNLQF